MARFGAGAIAAVGYAVIGVVWTMLELTPQGLGFEDTDDPAVSLAYLREHANVYAQAGLALFAMAIALTVVVFATSDALARRTGSLALRVTTTAGLFAAACLFLFGVLRFSVHPLLYIDGLDNGWGEAAYLAIQMLGIHGVGQASIFVTSAWVVAVAVLGVRAGVVPRWLAALAVLPGLRLVALIGPFVAIPDDLWIVYMLAIPGTAVWFGLLGVVVLRRPALPDASAAGAPVLVEA